MKPCATFLLVLLLPVSSLAEVYTWTDEGGVTHFSTEKPHDDAKPADLPEINRGEVKLAKKAIVSCGKHGGIDCSAGSDVDGSVICYDGFTGASARYRRRVRDRR